MREFHKINFSLGSGPGIYMVGGRQVRDKQKVDVQWKNGIITTGTCLLTQRYNSPGTISTSISQTQLEIETIVHDTFIRISVWKNLKIRFLEEEDKEDLKQMIENTQCLKAQVQQALNRLYQLEADLSGE